MRRLTWGRIVRDPLLWVLLGLLVVYVGVASLRPAGTFWSLDEGGKFLYLQNTIRTGDPRAPLAYPGQTIDRDLKFVPLYWYVQDGGRIYPWWPVGFPLLSLPLYRWFGWIGLYVLPILAGLLCAAFAGLLARQWEADVRWGAPVTAAIVGLATPVAFYSTMFWEHTPAAACAMAAVVAAFWSWRRDKIAGIVLAGALLSVGTFLRSETACVAAGLGLALLIRRWRWSLVLGGSFLVSCLPWLLLNHSLMGSFLGRQWGPGANSVNVPLFMGLRQAGAWFIPYVLFNSPKIGAYVVQPKILIIAVSLTAVALLAPLFKATRTLALVASLGVAAICGSILISREGYRSVHGFVLVAPQVVLAAWLYATVEGRRKFFSLCLVLIVLVYAGALTSRGWDAAGGQQWGPRYLLPLYPLLAAATVIGMTSLLPTLGRWQRSGFLVTLGLCVAIGFGFAVRGWQASYQTTHHYQQTAVALRPLTTVPVVTNCTWLPMILPEFYWTGAVFDVQNDDELQSWQAYARAAGITSAHAVKLDYCASDSLDEIAAKRETNPSGLTLQPVQITP